MKNDFLISSIPAEELDAMIKNIMAQAGISDPREMVRMVNSGEMKISLVTPKWLEKNGVIHFSVTSEGLDGYHWVSRLESRGFKIGAYAEMLLRSKKFQATKGITYEVAVLKGGLFSDDDRNYRNIRQQGKNLNYAVPSMEIACLIREKFSNEDFKNMGLESIVVMHKPKKTCLDLPIIFDICFGGNFPCLGACLGRDNSRYGEKRGFAFISHS